MGSSPLRRMGAALRHCLRGSLFSAVSTWVVVLPNVESPLRAPEPVTSTIVIASAAAETASCPLAPAAPKAPVAARTSGAIGYRKAMVGRLPAHIVTVDLRRRDVRVSVALTRWGIGGSESWPAFINRTRPTAAITGTYFDTATCIPVGSLVIGGVPVHRGARRTALGITQENAARFLSYRGGRASDAERFEVLIQAGPRLLSAGRTTLDPRAEGFRDRAIYARKPRTAVGLTRHGKLLLVAVTRPIYLREMVQVMRDLGARDAMALDGGSSSGLYCRGRSHVVPRRSLTNLLVIYESEETYLRSARQLVPGLHNALIRRGR